jgi:hypothetical protein
MPRSSRLKKSGRRHSLKSGFLEIVLESPLRNVLINPAWGWEPRRAGESAPIDGSIRGISGSFEFL